MKKCRHERDAHRYFDGELKEGGASRFEAHLERCEACRTMLGELRGIKNIFAERSLADLPFEFERRTIEKAAARPARRKRWFNVPTINTSRKRLIPVAASIVLLCIAGLFFTAQGKFYSIFGRIDDKMTSWQVRQAGMEAETQGLARVGRGNNKTQNPSVRNETISRSQPESNGKYSGVTDEYVGISPPSVGGSSIPNAVMPSPSVRIEAKERRLKEKNSGVIDQYVDINALSVGGSSIPNSAPYDATFFENYGVNPFISTEDERFSTFGMDVDTASYAIARRFIRDGAMPDKDSVRTEEFINYFDQDYPNSDGVFGIFTEGAKSEFGKPNYHLLKIGIKANEVSLDDRRPANMVFVVDVSGSMEREDRLEQVKRSLKKLAAQLKKGDRIGLVVYGSRGRVISDPTSQRNAILNAIEELVPEGSTNAEEGLRLAYKMARRNFEKEKINMIILCSDGVANVGITGADEILKQVKADAEKGIALTTIGFGMGNYNDVLMEKLANHGDGSYHYIDSDEEADRLFGGGAAGLLRVLASDAKIQVEFNERAVERFRLLGYENRRLKKEDFEDDAVDAGEVGAGQTVTALYELRIKDAALAKPGAVVATVRIRYMDAESKRIRTNEKKVFSRDMTRKFESASPRFRFTAAVAEFAELLKESYWAKDGGFEGALKVAEGSIGSIGGEKEMEFIELVRAAKEIKKTGAKMPSEEYQGTRPERVECTDVYPLSDAPMVIPMADGKHYISAEIAVCVDAAMVGEAEFKTRIPQMKHIVNDTLSRISKEDLFGTTVSKEQKAEMEALGLRTSEADNNSLARNIDNIRGTLLQRLSGNFPWITDVYFTSFLIQ